MYYKYSTGAQGVRVDNEGFTNRYLIHNEYMIYFLSVGTYMGFEQCIVIPEYTDNENLLKRLYEYADIADK